MHKGFKRLFSYFNDSHLRTSTPSCRRDKEFYEGQLTKFQQALDAVEQSPYTFHGGDLFSLHDPAISLVYDAILLLRRRARKLLINPGNHDFFGAQEGTLRRSGLGLLMAADVIDLMISGEAAYQEAGHPNVIVRSAPYQLEYSEKLYWFEKKQMDAIHVIMLHDMLTTREVIFPHRLISKVKTNADVVLCSHWHEPFIVKVGATWFINSGPLEIQSVGDVKLKPAVVHVDISSEGALVPSFEYLAHTGYEKVEASEKPLAAEDVVVGQEFIEHLKASVVTDGSDIPQAIRCIAQAAKSPVPVIERALERVEVAKKTLDMEV